MIKKSILVGDQINYEKADTKIVQKNPFVKQAYFIVTKVAFPNEFSQIKNPLKLIFQRALLKIKLP